MNNRTWCNCEDQGTCIGCLIENKIKDPYAIEEMIVKYYYGTQGLEHYEKHMKQFDFRTEG